MTTHSSKHSVSNKRAVRLDDRIAYQRDFAVQLARDAGSIIKSEFRFGIEKKMKPDHTVVTPIDIKVNDMVVKAIRREFPKHDVVAEEGSYLGNRGNYTWVCDPIDGTIDYSHGVPNSAFSLSLTYNGQPFVGVVYDPFMDRMYTAIIRRGAFFNGTTMQVSKNYRLQSAVVGLSYWKGAQAGLSALHERLIDAGASVLMLGSITYMGALVAVGEFSASIHPARKAYDSSALKLIVEEAGGKVTDLYGHEPKGWDGRIRGAIMSNGVLHEKLADLLRD